MKTEIKKTWSSWSAGHADIIEEIEEKNIQSLVKCSDGVWREGRRLQEFGIWEDDFVSEGQV